eukprot:12330-Heterococcus_DN1.PRE.3
MKPRLKPNVFLRTGLPFIVFVAGGAYALSFVSKHGTVHRQLAFAAQSNVICNLCLPADGDWACGRSRHEQEPQLEGVRSRGRAPQATAELHYRRRL